jgi:hypothetical protein
MLPEWTLSSHFHGFRERPPDDVDINATHRGCMALTNAFGSVTPAVQKAVHRTRQTHFLEPFLERLTTTVNPDRHIVQRSAQACSDAITRLPEDIGAPDDVRILRL